MLCLRDSGDCLLLVLSLVHWLSTVVPGWLAMVSKLRRGVRGSRVQSVQRESWQVRSVLMGERSGRAHSVQNRMCGRGGVTGAVKMTSQQGCVASTGRRSPRGRESGLRALQRRAGRKTERPGVWKQSTRNSEQGLMPWRRREGRSARRAEYLFQERRRHGRYVGRGHGHRGCDREP